MTGQPITPRRHGLARTLSKLGLASRTSGADWVRAGLVSVNGQVVLDPEFPVEQSTDRLTVNGAIVSARERVYVLLNKPRGLVTTTADEQNRPTVYRCFDGSDLPWLAPVGRLDKASEGLLLFSNDPVWAARLTDPATGPDKTYAVQINALPGPTLLAQLVAGVTEAGEHLAVKSAALLRTGEKNAWLTLVLTEGRNRHLRRLLAAHQLGVLRLIRVAQGSLSLGALPRGQWRRLSPAEQALLSFV